MPRARRRLAPALALPLLLAALPGLAEGQSDAVPAWYETFDLPEGVYAPAAVSVAPDGRVWFSARHPHGVGWIDPATGASAFFNLTGTVNHTRPGAEAANAIAFDASGLAWVANGPAGHVVAVDAVAGPGTPLRLPAGAVPVRMALAQDGSIWATDFVNGALYAIPASTGEARTYKSGPGRGFVGLALDGNGIAYAADAVRNEIVRVDPAKDVPGASSGTVIATGLRAPVDLLVAGGVAWIGEHGSNTVARVPLQNGDNSQIQRVPFPVTRFGEAPGPLALASEDEGGAIWVVMHTGNAVARYDPETRDLHAFVFPEAEFADAALFDLDAQGNAWVSLGMLNKLARISPAKAPALAVDAPSSVDVRAGASATTHARATGANVEDAHVVLDWAARNAGLRAQLSRQGGADNASVAWSAPEGAQRAQESAAVCFEAESRIACRHVTVQVAPASMLPGAASWAVLAILGMAACGVRKS